MTEHSFDSMIVVSQAKFEVALQQGNSTQARFAIQDALTRKFSPKSIYLEVLLPAVKKIRRLVNEGQLDAEYEEFAIDQALEQTHLLRAIHPQWIRLGLRAVVVPLAGHLGRFEGYLAADLLRLEGWEVDFYSQPVLPYAFHALWKRRPADLLVLIGEDPISWKEVEKRTEGIPAKYGYPACLVVGTWSEEPVQDNVEGMIWQICPGMSQLTHRAQLALAIVGRGLKYYLEMIGLRIRNSRKGKGWTQEQFARCLGKPRSYISRLENGRTNVSIGGLQQIARVLGVKISDLTG
jgi:DNA-binding XRE family transcriptional regulator